MVGLGEEWSEILDTIRDIRSAGTDVLTVGQYLRPSPDHLPLERYYTPAEFDSLRAFALELGYGHVESGPLVRSSYHADEQVPH
jgi:lipoic acid synthetase